LENSSSSPIIREMSRKKAPSRAAVPKTPPRLHEASLESGGSVIKGSVITRAEAEDLRRQGRDVVVCGTDLAANRSLARAIEQGANGSCKRCGPHANAGPNALPHFQPDPRPPEGHTFYETPNRKAV
jgi:hypothetical protein